MFSEVTAKIDSSIISDLAASVGDNRRSIEQVLWGLSGNLDCRQEGRSWYISGCFNDIAEAEAHLRELFRQRKATGKDTKLVSSDDVKTAVNLGPRRTETESTVTGRPSDQKKTTKKTSGNKDGAVGGAKPETGTFKLLLFTRRPTKMSDELINAEVLLLPFLCGSRENVDSFWFYFSELV